MITNSQTKVLSADELSAIERELYKRLTAPATPEQQLDLVDYSTRVLRRVLQSHKTLNAQPRS